MNKCIPALVCGLLLLPVWAGAETIYVVDTRLESDTPTVEAEPTAFAQSLDLDRYAGRFITAEEVLRCAAGANVRSIGGLGGYATVSLRGAAANQCLVLLDGVRLNSSAGGGVDLSKIPLESVQRIEVIRGSDAALFGDAAMGGIVNIVTRDPSDAPSCDAALTLGSYDTRELRGAVSTPLGAGWGLRLDADLREAQNDYPFVNTCGTEHDERDDFDDTRTNNALEDRTVQAKLTGHGGNWRLEALVSDYAADKEIPGIVTFPTPNATQQFDRRLLSTRAQVDLPHELQASVSWGRAGQGDVYDDPDSATSPHSELKTRTDEAGVLLSWESGEQSWGGLTLSPGITWTREHLDDDNVGMRARSRVAPAVRLGYDRRDLRLLATVRRDDDSAFDDRTSWRTGLSWWANDWVELRLNGGTGYRVPSFYELYYCQGFMVGNPGLVPEKSSGVDAGLVVDRGAWGGSFNGFCQRYDDQIVYILQSGFYYRPYNIARTESKGCELYLWAEPLSWLRLSGTWTFNKAVDATGEPNRDGNQVPGQPRNLFNLQVDGSWQVKNYRLGAFVTANHTEGNFVTRANTKKIPDRDVLNLGLSIAGEQGWSVNLEVKNLLDNDVYDLRGFPLEGRSLFATVRWSW